MLLEFVSSIADCVHPVRRGVTFVMNRISKLFGMGSKRPMPEDALREYDWPATWPFSPSDFSRSDETSDAYFYNR